MALHVHNTTANADSIYYVQTDLLGSRERIVDGNRNVVQSCHFDPWGNRMSASDWTLAQDGTGFAFRRGIAAQSPNMEITLVEVKNGPYANFTPNQKIVYLQMMLDHAPIVPLGQNAANVWGPAQVGQPTTNYTIIIKLF